MSLYGVLTFLFASVACVYFVWIISRFLQPVPGLHDRFSLGSTSSGRARFPRTPARKPPGRAQEVPALRRLGLPGRLPGRDRDLLQAAQRRPHGAPSSWPPSWRRRYKKAFLIVVFFLASAALPLRDELSPDLGLELHGRRAEDVLLTASPSRKTGVTFDTTGSVDDLRGLLRQDAHPGQVHRLSTSSTTSSAGSRASPGTSSRPSLFLVLFFIGAGGGREQWLLFAALAVEILIYIVLMPTNYGGGGGSLANRYFLNIFPLFFFLPAAEARHEAPRRWPGSSPRSSSPRSSSPRSSRRRARPPTPSASPSSVSPSR